MIKEDITFDEMLADGLESLNIIDVRSPAEFLEDHIPGAVNVPILDNEERREIGILYKQEGPHAARFRGVELLSPRLPQFIKDISENTCSNTKNVVYCWRGGLRSFAAMNLAKIAGIKTFKLDGGYKTFRKGVNAFFENFADYKFMTVYGATGCAKTKIIQNVMEKGIPAVDLEYAAAHKGSTFGNIDEPRFEIINQKSFETYIWQSLQGFENNLVITEGESRKIGKVFIPPKMFDAMGSGAAVIADAPMDFRVSFTIENYKPHLYVEEIRESLHKITRYLGKAKVAELDKMLDDGDFETFTRLLLVEYYDPMYKYSFPEKTDYIIRYSSIEEGAKLLQEVYENEMSKNAAPA